MVGFEDVFKELLLISSVDRVEARKAAFFLAGSVELNSVTLEATESFEDVGGGVFGSAGGIDSNLSLPPIVIEDL